MLKTLAGTNWGQQKETLIITYKVLGRSIANYTTVLWSKNSSESNTDKMQRAQNEALRIITCSHKMSSIDHLHSVTEMLCLGPPDPSFCAISGTLSGHRERLSPNGITVASTRQKTLQAIHTPFGNATIDTRRITEY